MYKNDRRMFDRFDVDFSAKIKHREMGENYFAECCDISAGGIGLLTKEKLISNANLELLLGFPNGHAPFRGLARVVWSKQVQENKWRSGLEFETVNFIGLRRIFETLAPKG